MSDSNDTVIDTFDDTPSPSSEENSIMESVEQQDRLSLLEAEISVLKTSLQTLSHRTRFDDKREFSLIPRDNTRSSSTFSSDIFARGLENDSYSFMMCFRPCGSDIWFYGLVVFIFQLSLVFLIILNQIGESDGTTPFDVPFNVPFGVHAGQVLALLVGVTMQRDITAAISNLLSLQRHLPDDPVDDVEYIDREGSDNSKDHNTYNSNWTNILIELPSRDPTGMMVWASRVLFPCICKLCQGLLVLFTTFIIVVQSENTIELFKDFAAMQVISELDNMAFWLAENGYCGKSLARKTKLVKRVRLSDDDHTNQCATTVRFSVIGVIFLAMLTGWGYIVYGQVSGSYFFLKFPNCPITDTARISKFNDGICHGGAGNSVECKFDGGDCVDFNIGFPECSVLEPFKVGDGSCGKCNN